MLQNSPDIARLMEFQYTGGMVAIDLDTDKISEASLWSSYLLRNRTTAMMYLLFIVLVKSASSSHKQTETNAIHEQLLI